VAAGDLRYGDRLTDVEVGIRTLGSYRPYLPWMLRLGLWRRAPLDAAAGHLLALAVVLLERRQIDVRDRDVRAAVGQSQRGSPADAARAARHDRVRGSVGGRHARCPRERPGNGSSGGQRREDERTKGVAPLAGSMGSGSTVYVGDVMSRPLETISASATVEEAAERMHDEEINALFVPGASAGIVTSTDVVDAIAEGTDLSAIRVSDVMTSPIERVTMSTEMTEAAAMMTNFGIKHLPVIDEDGDYVGMISSTDMTTELA
jgi:IMP dehydrogenase